MTAAEAPPAPPCSSLEFTVLARALNAAARTAGLPPAVAWRSPPAVPGVTRTLRRRPDGGAIVAIAFHDRPVDAVAGDMLTGLLRSHGLNATGEVGRQLRAAVLDTLEGLR